MNKLENVVLHQHINKLRENQTQYRTRNEETDYNLQQFLAKIHSKKSCIEETFS